MKYFRVKNNEKYQHYKDRRPIWIKLYNELLDDEDFEELPDPSKYHFIAIMLLASRKNNILKCDPSYIKRKISAKSPVDLNILLAGGFIEIIPGEDSDSDVLAGRYQDASLEIEKRREYKEETEREKNAPAKTNYAEFVTLTEKQHLTLIGKYGSSDTARFIEKLNNHKGAGNVKYTSDYHAILKWVVNAVSKETPTGKKETASDRALALVKKMEAEEALK